MLKLHHLFLLLIFSLSYLHTEVMISAQVITSAKTKSSVSPISDREWRVTLNASEKWFDTGIQIQSGTMLRLSATGSIVWDPKGNENGRVNPNGAPYTADSLPNASDFPLPSANCGSLVMRIGNSIYAVGEGGYIQVDESGTIQLIVNDRVDWLYDNSGSFQIYIKLIKPLQKAEVNGVIFDLIDARMQSGNVVVTLILTSNGSDRELTINGSGYFVGEYTKMFDSYGNEYTPRAFKVADKTFGSTGAAAKLISGIPVFTEVTFSGVSLNANKMSLLQIAFFGDARGQAVFRNTPILK